MFQGRTLMGQIQDNSENEPGRAIFLDALRIVSICAIVLLHVAGSFWHEVDVKSFNWQAINVYDCITRWGVPVFVMISGALFLDPHRKHSAKKIWTKNIPHIAILILFWGVLYALVYDRPSSFSMEEVGSFIHESLFGTPHLWFLFMLIGLYAIVPILRCVTANESALKYFILLGFVVNVLFQLFYYLSDSGIGNEIIEAFRLQLPVGFSFYFVLGYFLVSRELSKRVRIFCYVLGIAGICATVVFTSLASVDAGAPDTRFLKNGSLQFFAAVSIFIMAKRFFDRRELSEHDLFLLEKLSSCTLGVYVTHIFVIRVIKSFGVTPFAFNPLIATPLMAIVVCAISFAVVYILRKIPGVKKLI